MRLLERLWQGLLSSSDQAFGFDDLAVLKILAGVNFRVLRWPSFSRTHCVAAALVEHLEIWEPLQSLAETSVGRRQAAKFRTQHTSHSSVE